MKEPAREGSAPRGADGKASPQAKPADCLTSAESRRKFDILDAIDAIPVKLMPSSLKPLARQITSYSRYGRRLCYASYASLGKKTGCSQHTVRNKQLPRLVELGWFIPAGRRSTKGRSRPLFALGPKLVRFLRYWFVYVDTERARKRGETCDPLGSTRVDPLGVTDPYSSAGPKNRHDEPPGRPDVRFETAPSVPVEESNSDGGTIPFSSPSTFTLVEEPPGVDDEKTYREMVNNQIDHRLADGQALPKIKALLMNLAGRNELHRRVIAEEIARRCASA